VSPAIFSAAVEGATDEAALRRIVQYAGGAIGTVYGKRGKEFLRKRISGFNNAARFSPWIVLVDLNSEFVCAPALTQNWLANPANNMCLRVAVHKIESWLIADKENIARFLSVSETGLPQNPELELDPKATLVSLAAKSRSKSIRQDICPSSGSGRKVGPAYTARIIEFIGSIWQPQKASLISPSLKSSIDAIKFIINNPAPN
jgi:hypothetical protein